MYQVFMLLMFFCSSCSLLSGRGNWGERAFSSFHSSRLKHAFIRNISSPHVWGPVALAGIIHTGAYDQKISDWATEKNTIFGSKKNATAWSDTFNEVLLGEMYLTPILTPSMGDEGKISQYLINKAKGYGVVAVSSRATDFSHDLIAKHSHRDRPNKKDSRSFPSGHATQAGSRSTITSRNLDAIAMDESFRSGFKVANTTLAGGVMWARLEAKRHYSTDVLIGYALSSFLSGFIYDSILNYDSEESGVVSFIPVQKGMGLQYYYWF